MLLCPKIRYVFNSHEFASPQPISPRAAAGERKRCDPAAAPRPFDDPKTCPSRNLIRLRDLEKRSAEEYKPAFQPAFQAVNLLVSPNHCLGIVLILPTHAPEPEDCPPTKPNSAIGLYVQEY